MLSGKKRRAGLCNGKIGFVNPVFNTFFSYLEKVGEPGELYDYYAHNRKRDKHNYNGNYLLHLHKSIPCRVYKNLILGFTNFLTE